MPSVPQIAFNNTKVHSPLRCPNLVNPDYSCKRHPQVVFNADMTIDEWYAIDAPDEYPNQPQITT